MESALLMLPLRVNNPNTKKKKRPEVGRVENSEGHKDPKTEVETVADMLAVCLLGRMMKTLRRKQTLQGSTGSW